MLNNLIEQLLDHAVENFKSTKKCELLHEKLDQMYRDCETMLKEEQQDFVNECFDLIAEVSEQEEQYIYRRGLFDCIAILKGLGVLA